MSQFLATRILEILSNAPAIPGNNTAGPACKNEDQTGEVRLQCGVGLETPACALVLADSRFVPTPSRAIVGIQSAMA